jgi:mannosyltransferase OCH1-like enzyme
MNNDIPKIIHQTAPANKTKWHPLWNICQPSWLRHFPDWKYKLWTDEDLETLIKEHFPWFYPTYIGYDQHIKRIDAARYFVLYKHGGMYADMDFECINNFEHLIPDGKVSIAESPHWNDGRNETHQNALMISPVEHPFWINVFILLENNKHLRPGMLPKKFSDVLYATGPQIIVQAIRDTASDNFVHTLPYAKFAPQHDQDFRCAWKHNVRGYQLINDPSIYARHHGTGVWAPL